MVDLATLTPDGTHAASAAWGAALLETSRDAIVVLDQDGRLVEFNPAAERLFGCSRASALGRDMADLIIPAEWRDRYRQGLARCLETEEGSALAQRIEIEAHRVDGSHFPVEVTINQTVCEGRLLLIGCLRDIAAQRQAEEALRKREEWLRFALQSASMFAWDWDLADGTITRSGSARELLGQSPRSVDAFHAMVHPDDLLALKAALAQALAGEESFDREFRIVLPEGRIRWLRDRAQVSFDAAGRPIRMAGVCVDVTEHERIAKAVRAGEQRFQAMIETSWDGVALMAADGTLHYVSPAITRILGHPVDSVVGLTLFDLIHPDDQARVSDVFGRLLAEPGVSLGFECRVRHCDGDWRWIESTVTNLLGEESVQAIVSNFRDITERKQAETELQASEERLRRQNTVLTELARGTSLDHSDLAAAMRVITETAARTLELERVSVWLYHDERSLIRCADLYELSRDHHSKGAALAASSYPAYFEALQEERTIAADDALTDLRTREFAPHYLKPLGITSMLDAPIRLRDQMVGVVCHEHVGPPRRWTLDEQNFARSMADLISIALEASERQRAEAALRDSEERFKSAFENAAVGMALVATDGRWLQVNRRVSEIVGYAETELLATDFQSITHPEDLETDLDYVRQVLSGELRTYQMEKRYLHKRGHAVWVLLSVSLVRDEAQRPLYFISQIQDITATKEAEEQLRAFAAQLERHNRELQEFTYVASHDLQEPLRKIEAFGDRLRTRCGEALGDDGRDYLERMQNAASRMRTLIQDLLAFSRVTTNARPFVAVDLVQVAQEVVSDLETRIEQTGGRVEVGELPTLAADPTQMRQLLQNLIGNALKFRLEEKPPVVRVSAEALPGRGRREADGARSGAGWQIRVADNGIGFEEKYLDRIFNPFQRLHGRSEYEGTGIGLAICRKIVERHGGSLTATSTPGQGSTFIITIPVKQSRNEDGIDGAA